MNMHTFARIFFIIVNNCNVYPQNKILVLTSYFWIIERRFMIGGIKLTADVSLDFKYDAPVEQVWDALTDSETLAKWIWENDFKPEVGHKFQFRAEPNEWWDGIVNGEVLEVNEPQKLSYTWASQGETTTITWTLKEVSEGRTELHFEQSGFSEETKSYPGALDGAKSSWMEFGKKLKTILEK